MAASLEVGGWRAELEELLVRFGRLFVRSEPREQAGRYLEGLLGSVERKNGWQLAEAIGDARPWRTQRVLSHVLWDEEAARGCRAASPGGGASGTPPTDHRASARASVRLSHHSGSPCATSSHSGGVAVLMPIFG